MLAFFVLLVVLTKRAQGVFPCEKYGIPSIQINEDQVCGCPADSVFCGVENPMCVPLKTACTGAVDATDQICVELGQMALNCSGTVKCRTKSEFCCPKDLYLCAETCETPTCPGDKFTNMNLGTINTTCGQGTYPGKETCGQFKCKIGDGFLFGWHPSSPCIERTKLCAAPPPKGCADCTPDQYQIGCTPGNPGPPPVEDKCICLAQTEIKCPASTLSCGSKYGDQCLDEQVVKDACLEAATTTTSTFINPNANDYRAAMAVSVTFIAIAGVVAIVGGVASTIPILLKTAKASKAKPVGFRPRPPMRRR